MTVLEVEPHDNRQLQNIANTLAGANKVVVVTGAGISTNCGIPDFRSQEGLYALIQSSYAQTASTSPTTRLKRTSASAVSPSVASVAGNIKGKDLFDSMLWKDPLSTSVFYTFIASLRARIRDEVKATTPTHRFIRTLRDSRKLMRCYTQNIDGLEARAGLCTQLERGKGSRSRFTKKTLNLPRAAAQRLPGGIQDGGCEVVQLHGDLETLRCTLCQKIFKWGEGSWEILLLRGKAPECLSCTLQDQERRERGKRGTKVGTLRPNIVLYGEEHPAASAISDITTNDLSFAPDVLLILGTSLHVHGLKVLVKEFAKAVHARAGGKGKVIFVNLTKPPESVWSNVIDYWVSMDCDQWVSGMKRHRPDIWQMQSELDTRVTKVLAHPQTPRTTKEGRPNKSDDKENQSPYAAQSEYKTKPAMLTKNSRFREMGNMSCAEIPITADPNTPWSERGLKRKRSQDIQQLPTPPSSGHRRRFQGLSKSDLCDSPNTPTKRRKTGIVIYEDW